MQKLFKKKINKIGILGGTFDTPHLGHLHISKIALRKFKLNKLIWVVSKKNPLKKKSFLNIKKRVVLIPLPQKSKYIPVFYMYLKLDSKHL